MIKLNNIPIDSEILDLIVKLNEFEFKTCFCCQGRLTKQDFIKKTHSITSYIQFINPIPCSIVKILQQEKLYVYNSNLSVASGKFLIEKAYFKKTHIETLTELEMQKIIALNIAFQDKIKIAFKL